MIEPGLAATELLATSEFFRYLPDDARAELATHLVRLDVAAGNAIVQEGEPAHSYFLIAAGEVEVWTGRGSEPAAEQHGGTMIIRWQADAAQAALVGRLGVGQGFGELALLLGRPRGATVVARSDVVLYRIDARNFLTTIERHRGLLLGIEEEMLLRAVATTLGKSSPFAGLAPDALRWLAPRVETRSYPPGEEIVRQGDAGDALFVVRTGTVGVIRSQPDGSDRQVDTMSSGDAFGEQALLTGEVRSATIRALEPVEVLRLGRDDFTEVVRQYKEREGYFVDLLFRRQHPRRIEQWSMERQGDGAATYYMLQDTASHRYLKISEEVAFLWDRMDGTRNVRDLTLEYAERFDVFAVEAVIEAMLQLHAAGFVVIQRFEAAESERRQSRFAVALAAIMRVVAGSVSFRDADPLFTRFYRYVRPLFWFPVQVLVLAVAVTGTALFARDVVSGELGGSSTVVGSTLVILAGLLLHAVLHESAHALTCKYFGRAVHRAGLGWFLFLPSAFVETSDIWMAPRHARMAVALAGPYTNFVLSATATLIAPFADPFWQASLFQFASTGYFLGVMNLNPLIEFDGYFALMDWLDIPNLRAKAMSFLGGMRAGTGEVWSRRTSRIFVAYGVLSLGYTLFIVYSVLTGYHTYMASFVGRVLPTFAAEVVGWALALFIAYLVLQGAWTALRAGRPGPAPRPHRAG